MSEHTSLNASFQMDFKMSFHVEISNQKKISKNFKISKKISFAFRPHWFFESKTKKSNIMKAVKLPARPLRPAAAVRRAAGGRHGGDGPPPVRPPPGQRGAARVVPRERGPHAKDCLRSSLRSRDFFSVL